VTGLRIHVFGSSLVSSWWNGAATYYRGLLSNLAALGHHITFAEPDAFERQAHRDIPDPSWADVVVYEAASAEAVAAQVALAKDADVVIKTSGVGVFDDVLEREVAALGGSGVTTVFCDVDAPATLGRVEADDDDPFRELIPRYDLIVTYGGGEPVRRRYAALGASRCELVYNGFDPTTHHRVPPDPTLAADLSLMANRLPDREERIAEFFVRAATLAPGQTFLLGGNGWDETPLPANVRLVGHVPTGLHNAFNCSAAMVLNVTRQSMAENGWSPATRVFETTGVGACLITDAWPGIDDFFAPGEEVLVAADGAEVAALVRDTPPSRGSAIGAAAASRVAGDHTYAARAAHLDGVLREVAG
jgi:spore maturation protein CgeB